MNNMSDRAMSAWSTLTSQWGSPLTLKSAYRDPVQNALANGARDSQHLHGNAFDVSTAGMSPEERASLIQAAQAAGFTGFGGYDNSLHFDVGPSRTWGSDYSGATTPDWLRSALGSAPVQVSTSGGPSMPMQEQPRGLFGFLGGEQTPDARTADQRKADLFNTLALGFNEMRLRPSQSLATGIQNRMASDRQGRQTQMAANRTIEWLKTQPGGEQFAAAVETGAIPAGSAIQAYMQSRAAPDQTAAMQNYEFLVQNGVDPQQAMERAFSGGTNITVGGGPEVGTIPQGYELYKDPDTGAYRMQPIAGGPADTSAATTAASEQTGRSAGVVLEDINRLQTMLDESMLPVTGAGSLLKIIPGTNALNASKLVQTIAGNIGFDRLQQMREASPTGGALGSVSEQELSTLQSVLGSLDMAQSQDVFEYNLNRLEQIYTEIMRKASAYPNASQFGFGGGATSSDGFSVTGQVGQ